MRRPDSNGIKAGYRQQTNTVRSGASSKPSIRHRWGVILAGGDGTRLQPLTRLTCGDNRPKQFCPLLGGKTLLAHTRQRIARTVEPDHVLFVLTKKHERFYTEELKFVPESQMIIQPYNQGTFPAILWSLVQIFRADKNALVAFFPSDHHFANEDSFISTIETTFDLVEKKHDSVILLGAEAERPETEYGWIEPESAPEGALGRDFVPVRRFWEKPPLETARVLLTQGCLWNTFVMIGSVGAFLEMIRKAAPTLFETFNTALPGDGLESDGEKMRIVYDGLDPSDFSREVLALSTERLFVANCGEVGWSDLGEPHRFIAALTENGSENPWATAEICNKCGLTREQIATLSGPGKSETSIHGPVTLTSSS